MLRFIQFCFLCIPIVSCQQNYQWWQTGPIYQVYPASFADSNGDGWGDLPGILEHVDYFKDIGVRTVWLSPIYQSPMMDNGYDVSNYTMVNPMFGTVDDVKDLLDALHDLGISLILDFVPNHTSNESVWFQDSINRSNGKDDFYVWKDPVLDSENNMQPPNNWVSDFGGSAWTYVESRNQYYLHQFGVFQPDLNYSNPQVLEEIKKCIQFWIDIGIDGFRMDAVIFLAETHYNMDEPQSLCAEVGDYNCYDHIYTTNQPLTYRVLKDFERLLNASSNNSSQKAMFVEAYTDINHTMSYYGPRTFPFNFQILDNVVMSSNATTLNNVVKLWLDNMPLGQWPNWVLGNHDNSRVGTRMGDQLIDAMNMLSLLLPGTPITFYGEEIGMVDECIPDNEKRDTQNRDPERTPMQWTDGLNAGFSTSIGSLYLPVNPNYWVLNVDCENQSNYSHLSIYKSLVDLHGDFINSTLTNLTTYVISDWVFAFERPNHLVVINLDNVNRIVTLKDHISTLPSSLTVKIPSMNSGFKKLETIVPDKNVTLLPRSGLVLSTSTASKLIMHSSLILVIFLGIFI